MSYRWAILTNWSRRDRLAVVVVATIVAMLVGTTLLVVTAGATTAEFASDRQLDADATATVLDRPPGAGVDAPPEAVVLPVATVEVGDSHPSTATGNDASSTAGNDQSSTAGDDVGAAEASSLGGREVTVIGLPPGANASTPARLPEPPAAGLVGTGDPDAANRSVTLVGEATTLERDVVGLEDTGLLPPWWIVAPAATVDDLGATGTVVLTPGTGDTTGGRSVPLVGAVAFFAGGTAGLLRGLAALAVGIGVLVAVVSYSVTRMTVQDRLATIAVLRATGLPRWRILGLFAGRAAVLTGLATLGGAAAGVVLTNAALNAAVVVGVPTTLSLRLSPAALTVLLPALLGLVTVGVLAGVAAAAVTVRRSPAALHRQAAGAGRAHGNGRHKVSWIPGRSWLHRLALPALLCPRLLGRRAILPTAATLSVFVAVVLVAGTAGGALAPLASPDERTVMQGGAAHPWASSVDADYATALRGDGVAASPEILSFSVVDGRPFFTRGVEFGAFANLTGARLVDGTAPTGPGEAVVGRDLAQTLGVSVGDRLPLGGNDRQALTTVRVVGVFRGPGLTDDQLLVPLSTARHLSNTGPDTVNLVRIDAAAAGADPSPTDGPNATGGVVDVSVPATVTAGEPITVAVTLRNGGATERRVTTSVELDGSDRAIEETLGPSARRTVEVTFDGKRPGEYALSAGSIERTVTVVSGEALQVGPLPDRGPPGAELRVAVTDAGGEPVANASVGFGNGSGDRVRTDERGVAIVALPAAGATSLTVEAAGYRGVTRDLTVSDDASRSPVGRLAIDPARPDPTVRPTATLDLANPWNATLERSVTVTGPGTSETRRLTLQPGEERRLSTTLRRAGTGTHEVTARLATPERQDVDPLASTTYTVRGDQRVVSAMATSGRHQVADSGLGRAAAHALGNLQVIVGVLLALAGAATVAATTAAFSRTVHERRRTIGIHRATGATPGQVLRLVLADALRVALPATAVALVVGYVAVWLLGTTGTLTVFGVALVPRVSPVAFGAVGLAATGLAVVAAAVATVGLLRSSPARLFEPARTGPAPEGPDAVEEGHPDG